MPSPARPRSAEAAGGYCAIDFGTSNSAIAIPGETGMRLVELEDSFTTMPTAVFYAADGKPHEPPHREFGRAAIAAYVDGIDGRLMRSMKSILGSSLVEQTTDVGGGRGERYLDIVTAYLAHLKRRAEATAQAPIARVVLGRPVFFVDDDAAADAKAQASLRTAAQRAGFREIEFQYEPIAAAFDYEQGTEREEKVLVADIGGGTSDFSIVRVGPGRAARGERKEDILANHGVHIAGTDFDRRLELAAILPLFGYGAYGRRPRRARCSAVYFDLATWRLQPAAGARAAKHALLLCRSGPAPAAAYRDHRAARPRPIGRAEAAKIEVAPHQHCLRTRSGCSSCETCAPSMPIRPTASHRRLLTVSCNPAFIARLQTRRV